MRDTPIDFGRSLSHLTANCFLHSPLSVGEELGGEARKGKLAIYSPLHSERGWGVRLLFKTPPSPYHYLSSSKVVWNGILLSGDVCHPVIRVDVIDTEEVQTVQTEPDILKDCVAMAVVII